MLMTSQNRVSVNQAHAAILGGNVLAAAVVHQSVSAMCPHMGMRRTRRLDMSPTFPKSKRRSIEACRHQPGSYRSELALRPRLWARLVLSKTARG